MDQSGRIRKCFYLLKDQRQRRQQRTVHRRQRLLDRSPLSPARFQKPGFRALFSEPRIVYSIEGPEALGGALLLGGAVQGEAPRKVLPQGAQEKVTVSPRSEKLVRWRSLLLRRGEAGGRRLLSRARGLGAIEVCEDARLEAVALKDTKQTRMKTKCSLLWPERRSVERMQTFR